MAFEHAKDMFVLSSHFDFSPTRQLTHNGLNLCGKLLHTHLVKTIYSRNSSCELISNAHLILKWKVATKKKPLIIPPSFSQICAFLVQHLETLLFLMSINLLTLVFDHLNLLFDLEEIDYTDP